MLSSDLTVQTFQGSVASDDMVKLPGHLLNLRLCNLSLGDATTANSAGNAAFAGMITRLLALRAHARKHFSGGRGEKAYLGVSQN